jgi:hypothetical protein
MATSSNPFQRGSRGWGTLVHQNHGAGGGNGSIMVEMFVCLCLVSDVSQFSARYKYVLLARPAKARR